jgi:hypothetical protein
MSISYVPPTINLYPKTPLLEITSHGLDKGGHEQQAMLSHDPPPRRKSQQRTGNSTFIRSHHRPRKASSQMRYDQQCDDRDGGQESAHKLSPMAVSDTPEMGSEWASSISRRIRRERWSDMAVAQKGSSRWLLLEMLLEMLLRMSW